MKKSQFKFSDRFNSEKLLNKVINLAIDSYYIILENEKYVKNEMDTKRENQYRSDLVELMKKNKVDFGLGCLIINAETEEYNEGNVGLLDIKIQYSHFNYIDIDKNYHTIECKRLDKNLYFTDYYKHGICEFISGKYSRNTNHAGMICFIEEFNDNHTTEIIVDKLNNYLLRKNESILQKINHECFDYIYQSTHDRMITNEKISIKHLFFDYSSIFVDT